MFTGIIEDIGEVVKFAGQKLTFLTKLDGFNIGDSVAVNGICLTIVQSEKLNEKSTKITVEVSRETIDRTNIRLLKPKSLINLERALKLSSRLGGHIVSGHIDTTIKIKSIKKETNSKEKTIVMTFELPKHFAKYIVEKGSVTVDGVSLTVANILKDNFSIVLVPHTLKSTTLKYKKCGDVLNLEVDMIAKYVEKIQNNVYCKKNVVTDDEKLLKKLKENGFV